MTYENNVLTIKNSPKFGGADSIENYLSKIWGASAPQVCRWETPWCRCSYIYSCTCTEHLISTLQLVQVQY